MTDLFEREYKISLSESTSNRTIDSGMLEEEFSVVDEGPEENPNPDNLFGITLENPPFVKQTLSHLF